jgi:hypothetical protein
MVDDPPERVSRAEQKADGAAYRGGRRAFRVGAQLLAHE